MEYQKLFSPGKIGCVELKNRVIMGPTETLRASAIGEVTPAIIDYYTERAQGGVGMIILHSIQGNTDVDRMDPYAGSLRLDNDAYIPMMRELTEQVHQHGAKIASLVSIGGGARANGDRYPDKPGKDILVAPSPMAEGAGGRPVRALTVDEIHRTVEAYGKCALRAQKAGFDVFYIHALGSYLLAEFLSPVFNRRTDSYGGSAENRARLLFELVESCQRYAGKDFPLVVRFSVDELCENGRTLRESIAIAQKLEAAGVVALDLSVGMGERKSIRMPSIYVQPRTREDLIRRVKESVSIPVIYQGRLNDPAVAEQVLQDGVSDFVLLSRALIAEPDWVNKAQANAMDEARNCLCCNHCLAKRIVQKLPLRCAFNPRAGRESKYKRVPEKSADPKRIAIFGAGPAGLEAARVLAEKGHHVDVYEAADSICGGQLKAAQQPPCKEILGNIPRYYSTVLGKMDNVVIHLSCKVTPEALPAIQADEFVVATGAIPLVPRIPGMERTAMIAAVNVLNGETTVGEHVLIAGGGQVGVETAHYLANRGRKVTVIEMQNTVCPQEEPNTKSALLAELESLPVSLRTHEKILSMENGKVTTEDINGHERMQYSCDSIVLAFGMRSEKSLYDALIRLGKKAYLIGDAAHIANIANAIEQGFLLGNRIG